MWFIGRIRILYRVSRISLMETVVGRLKKKKLIISHFFIEPTLYIIIIIMSAVFSRNRVLFIIHISCSSYFLKRVYLLAVTQSSHKREKKNKSEIKRFKKRSLRGREYTHEYTYEYYNNRMRLYPLKPFYFFFSRRDKLFTLYYVI